MGCLMLAITILFQLFAAPISHLFQTEESSEMVQVLCMRSMRICTLGYFFMGITVLIQGILQGFRSIFSPLLLALLRLIVLPILLCLLFLQWKTGEVFVWWAFPIAEAVTAVTAIFLLHQTYRKRQKETLPGN